MILKAIFFSDAHLTADSVDKAELLQRFAVDVLGNANAVFILGDLFEFYHGYDGYIYPWYRGAIDILKKLAESGKDMVFFEGNHEFGMGRYFEDYTGIPCRQSTTVDLDGKKVFMSHGDGWHRFYLGSILKTRFIYAIMDALGPRLTWMIAKAARVFLSRKIKPYNERTKNIFREYARQKLDEEYDIIILAHSHMTDIVEFEVCQKKKVYLNTGDFGRYLDYVSYDSGTGFTLEKYDPSRPKAK